MEMPLEARREIRRDEMMQIFQAELERRLDRSFEADVQPIIPPGFFARASTECREMYIAGHFYGCISLCQSVAEGLATFLTVIHKTRKQRSPGQQIARLEKEKVISGQTASEFLAIWGNDRNDYHHLNPSVETQYHALQKRAAECLESLFRIESDLFAFTTESPGKLTPRNPQYWPIKPDGTTAAYLRCE